jgi:multidrug efflux system membrane fusion protein
MKITARAIRRPGLRAFAAAGLCVLVALTILTLRSTSQRARSADSAPSKAIPVVTALAAQEDMPMYLSGIGTVQPAQSVTVKTRVDGQLQKVAFTEGQDVREGDLLAQIDPRPYQALLDQAVAQKARDQANLTAAQRDLERYKTLVAQDSLQQQTLDTQQSTVDQLRASLQSDQAQIDNARVQLGYTTIQAPVRGRTGLRLVDAGNIVHATDATGLVVINQIDPIAVVFTLPESSFQSINKAMESMGPMPLAVTALGRENNVPLGNGRLLLLNNQIDTVTGTFQLKALFANPQHTLWPGQYVNVQVVLGTRRNVVTVPAAAVQRSADGLMVYAVKADESVAARPIRVAQMQDGKAIIDTGIAAGTRVIIDGQFKVNPGAKITEAPRANAASSAATNSGQ